uniref:Uncharacterized protein n=1 Tax=Anguilla anguilla TaxID=7936 RepID=A0A0E9QS04_ANGAN
MYLGMIKKNTNLYLTKSTMGLLKTSAYTYLFLLNFNVVNLVCLSGVREIVSRKMIAIIKVIAYVKR